MTIEEWLQAQKQAGNVSLPLYVDDNGNQCMQTHAYATRYGNSNVEKELNKLRTLDMNDRGIIKVPEGTNPLDLVNSGLYYTKTWADGNIPLSSSYCVIQVIACDDNIVFLKAYYPTSQTVFTNSSYLNIDKKRWFGWKLIEGEILLWSGSYTGGSTIQSKYDLSMFKQLMIIGSGVNAICIEASITDKSMRPDTAFNYSNGLKLLTYNGDRDKTMYITAGTIPNGQSITAIYGRP